MSNLKYTKEMLENIAVESTSIAQVIRGLGLKEAGGTHAHISRKLKEYEIDTSHFLGRAANCGDNHKGGKKKTWQEVLVFRSSGTRTKAVVLRRALIESGRKYLCEKCGQNDQWQGEPLTLEVEHKNNNWLDDRSENLQFLCPCCHSQRKHKMNQGLTDTTSSARYSRVYRKKKNAQMAE